MGLDLETILKQCKTREQQEKVLEQLDMQTAEEYHSKGYGTPNDHYEGTNDDTSRPKKPLLDYEEEYIPTDIDTEPIPAPVYVPPTPEPEPEPIVEDEPTTKVSLIGTLIMGAVLTGTLFIIGILLAVVWVPLSVLILVLSGAPVTLAVRKVLTHYRD